MIMDGSLLQAGMWLRKPILRCQIKRKSGIKYRKMETVGPHGFYALYTINDLLEPCPAVTEVG